MSQFIGRNNELDQLGSLLGKSSSSMVVIRGRRRIGKSRLIEEFAKRNKIKMYSFSGIPPEKGMVWQDQLDEFSSDMKRYFDVSANYSNWGEAFAGLAEKTFSGKVLILFDEISWMANDSPAMLGKLKNAWDRLLKKNDQLILVLCGSVSSWIKKNIINSKGFYGRISLKLRLRELPLDVCRQFWGEESHYISAQEKLKILSVTGGVPKYLEEVDPKCSAEENIKRLCFSESGILFNDFNHIFTSTLERQSNFYRAIVVALTNANAEQTNLLRELNVKSGGQVSEYIDELIDAGFIERHYTWSLRDGKTSRLSQYRLCDNYIRFYLKYIYPSSHKIIDQNYQFKSLANLTSWMSIMGLQVENLVINNRHEIIKKIGICVDDVINSGPYFQRKTQRIKGCQIDLLVQVKMNSLYVCEVKFSSQVIRIDIVDEVKEKVARLSLSGGFSIRPVLIHAGYVHDAVVDSGYFAKIINLSELLSDEEK
jgi:uncharacterized protein